jgi:hypothetical protein
VVPAPLKSGVMLDHGGSFSLKRLQQRHTAGAHHPEQCWVPNFFPGSDGGGAPPSPQDTVPRYQLAEGSGSIMSECSRRCFGSTRLRAGFGGCNPRHFQARTPSLSTCGWRPTRREARCRSHWPRRSQKRRKSRSQRPNANGIVLALRANADSHGQRSLRHLRTIAPVMLPAAAGTFRRFSGRDGTARDVSPSESESNAAACCLDSPPAQRGSSSQGLHWLPVSLAKRCRLHSERESDCSRSQSGSRQR